MPPRTSITGFDRAKFVAAGGAPRNDPWWRNEQWRYSGPFTRWNRFKGAFPGLGLATGAFIIYLAYDAVVARPDHSHAESGHH
ncbi:hypothetical protein EV356DRAFT_529184 [Viridothelium virens]|uniref:NADH-ubiquinone oxidoreductase B12 subunit n=1 Tax=Viridothelium virens TaxID=1048519 RepID=A0A6A6HL99_VIRVR|nr:hypothetical protein EV356DRAFT_529184 [Viridothelium virens]